MSDFLSSLKKRASEAAHRELTETSPDNIGAVDPLQVKKAEREFDANTTDMHNQRREEDDASKIINNVEPDPENVAEWKTYETGDYEPHKK